MARWAALLAALLLLACGPDGPEPDAPPADDTSQDTAAGEDSAVREATVTENGAEQEATDSSVGPDPIPERTVPLENGTATFRHQREFSDGIDSVAIQAVAAGAAAIAAVAVTTHVVKLFNSGPTPGRIRFQVNFDAFGLGDGATTSGSAVLRDPSGGVTPLEDRVPVTVSIPNNEPFGEDWELETRISAAIAAGGAATGAALVARYFILSELFGSCDTTDDCEPGLVCDAGRCACDDNGDCEFGFVCRDGFCDDAGCGSSFDCERGELCVFGQCEESGAGQPCRDSSQCARPFECLVEDFPTVCGECGAAVACPDGHECVGFECVDDSKPCRQDGSCDCDTRNDCAEGETCQRGVCTFTGLCESDTDCAAGFQCCTPLGLSDYLLGQERYCDRICPQHCSSDEECSTGSCRAGWCEPVECGDGFIDGNEDCDGADLDGADCVSIGNVGGTLACDPTRCEFDTAACVEPVCGDGRAEGDEFCDGGDLRGEGCAVGGFDGGVLACLGDCSGFDFSACACSAASCDAGQVCMDGVCVDAGGTCGDGVADPGEQCDEFDRDPQACAEAGFDGGAPGCGFFCESTTATCTCGGASCAPDEVCRDGECVPPGCGNGVLEPGEECDGEELVECDAGFDFGFTSCTGTCRADLTRCRCFGVVCAPGEACVQGVCGPDPSCGNGTVDPGEVCDGSQIGGIGCADLAGGFDGGSPTCSAGCDALLTTSCTCDGVTCGENETCADGRCACVPGASRCGADGSTIEACGEDGAFDPSVACVDGCVEGVCVRRERVEPNNTVETSQDLGSLGAGDKVEVGGDPLGFGDDSFYSITVTASGVLYVASREPPGGQPSDFQVFVFDAAALAPDESFEDCVPEDGCLGSDDDSGPGLFFDLAVAVEPGQYLIFVDAIGFPLDSELSIELQPVVCAADAVRCVGDGELVQCNGQGTRFDPFLTCASGVCDAGLDDCLGVAETEDNDTPAQADSLAVAADERVAAEGDSDEPGDLDYYEFTVADASFLAVAIDLGTVELLDDGLSPLSSAGTELGEIVEAGTYFLGAAPEEGGGSYRLELDVRSLACAPGEEVCDDDDRVRCADDGQGFADQTSCLDGCAVPLDGCDARTEREFNGSIVNAQPIGLVKPDGEVAYAGTLPIPDDVDYYRFTLEAPASAILETLERDINTVNTVMFLRQPDGTLIDSDDDGGEDPGFSRIDAPLQAGDFIVELRSQEPDSTGAYRLEIRALTLPPGGGSSPAADARSEAVKAPQAGAG